MASAIAFPRTPPPARRPGNMRRALRSLTVKLTLAFVLVGTVGAILVAALVGQRTRSEFDRFLSDRDQTALVQALQSYYAAHGAWLGVGDMLISTPPLDAYSRGLAVTDARGRALIGNRDYPVGASVPSAVLQASTALQSQGATVGYMLFAAPGGHMGAGKGSPPPEVAFLNRVNGSAAISAGIAALIALVLGVLLARTLTRPLRELTAATRALAGGTLDQQVLVRSHDEVGELAQSFNQMSADLVRASQLRKQMTADLAHDLRTPLTILRGYTEGLQDARLTGTPALYTIMHGEVEHLQRLVEDLRVLSLADAGSLPLNRRLVDPTALLERTALAYFMEAERRGVSLRMEAAAGLPSIDVDTDRVTQVLNNLVSNALRYTPAGGSITLRACSTQRIGLRNEGGQGTPGNAQAAVLVTVEDSGSGIAPDDLPLIFDRFYRADVARQRGDSATSGLGLAISKALVEAHGGTIAVASTLGAGATFTIALPTQRAACAAPQRDAGGEQRRGHGHS